MQEAQEVELYDKLMKLLSEMMSFDNKTECISPFSVLVRGIAVEIAEYESNNEWMNRKK